MIHLLDMATIVGICAIVAFVIGLAFGLLAKDRKIPVERPRKASLPPLHWGYKPRQDGGGLPVNRNLPKAPKGSGGGSY